MASAFQSIEYQRVPSHTEDDDDSSELPPTVVTTRHAEKNNGRWNHIENLDEFFTRVYKYHQAQGFICLILTDVFELVQYVFIVLFALFLMVYVDYRVLFDDPNPSFSKVVNWKKVEDMPSGLLVCVVVAFLFWGIRVLRVFHDAAKAWEMRQFFHHVLHIVDNDLQNMQWRDVQKKLLEVQKDHLMCIHKPDLTELDIHHRILRQKNYMIALQNKGVLTCLYRFPFIGKTTFLSEGMKFNLRWILFTGPGAPYEKSWKLKPEYKDYNCRNILARRLSRRIFLLGLINLILCPFILVYQILYSFFRYAELIKRSPDVFGARRWSPYGRLYLRHFNELSHEFQSRLSKAYLPASKYMNSFVSPVATIFARSIAFFAGAILAVLLGLSFYDQDVLTADNVLSFMATLGIIIKICAGFIPDENMVFCPETLMKQVLSHTHYIPDEWKGRAHTKEVREEFAELFQYKFVHVLEELLSPLLTPLILCFSVRHHSLQIVDFYRNFTVEVEGVGDVCSFAQMDIRRHGSKRWRSTETEVTREDQAHNGKTELSLLHFSIKNPTWKPSDSRQQFIDDIKENAIQESLSWSQPHPLETASIHSSLVRPSYHGDMSGGFVGLASLGQPSTSIHMEIQKEEALMNTSMIYMHNLHNQMSTHSFPDLPSMSQRTEKENLRRSWPQRNTQGHLTETNEQTEGEVNEAGWQDVSQYSRTRYPNEVDSWHHESRF